MPSFKAVLSFYMQLIKPPFSTSSDEELLQEQQAQARANDDAQRGIPREPGEGV